MKNFKNDFACNFEATDQKIIYGDIPSVKKAVWLEELEGKNITLCDLEKDGDNEIGILIGSDIAGKLLTGEKCDLSNGLTAFNTLLGWTIMGKVKKDLRGDGVTKEHMMFVAEERISDLWRLDTLGITDPIEKVDRKLQEQKVKENFLQTAFFAKAAKLGQFLMHLSRKKVTHL